MSFRVESFSQVLDDYLKESGMSERQFLSRVPDLHPTTFAELRYGVDPGNPTTLRRIVKGLGLDREWTSRFYAALLVSRDGEDLVRAAGLID